MLERVLRHLRNWFLVPGGVHLGTFTITSDGIELPFLQNGQYFRVVGSVFNDGVYKYGNYAGGVLSTAETFDGAIWALAIPPALVDTVKEIEEWESQYGAAVAGPYQSESFGGYTYTKATNDNGGSVTWQEAFRGRLNAWRKI